MSRKEVLLVGDDAPITEGIQMTLRGVGGRTVPPGSSGPEAVPPPRERAPDAILLDLMMPGMDGPATLTRLRSVASDQNVPVILLSAKVQQRRDDQQLTGLGVAGVIAKPFDPITLPDRISTILGWAA